MKQNYSLSLVTRLLAIGVSSVGTLTLLPLILDKLGEYNLGIWGMVSAITGYLLLLDFGVALACTRYLSMNSGSRQSWTSIISNSLTLAGAISLVLLCLAVIPLTLGLAEVNLLEDQHKLISTIIAVIMVEVALSIPLRMYLSILRTEVRYVDIGLFEIIRVILRIGGILFALFMGAQLLEIVILASLVNLLFYFLPCISVWKRHKTLFFSWQAVDRPVFVELLQFSKFTALSQLAEFLKFRTDSVLVALVLGITTSAHYTIIVFIVVMLTQILMRFMSYWDTIIIRHIGEEKPELAVAKVFRALEIGMWVSLLSLVNITIFGKSFISLWMGEQYSSLHTPLILLTLVLAGITVQMATTPYFNAIKREKTNAKLDLSEVILKLLLIYPFGQLFGLNGFILATLLASGLISIILRHYFLHQYAELSISELSSKLLKLSTRPLLASGGTLLLYLLMRENLSLSYFQVQLLMIPVEIIILGLVFRNQLKFHLKPKPQTLSSHL